jgi:hypothetical protein
MEESPKVSSAEQDLSDSQSDSQLLDLWLSFVVDVGPEVEPLSE